jgi:RimJ/RimL family protein N-acetyltransferase
MLNQADTYFRWPKVPHQNIQETEANIRGKIFKTPDASGALGRQFTFAVICADDPSHKVIGAVGINGLKPSPSIGYGIHPDFWGKGYASEAVAGIVDAWWKLPRKEPEPGLDTGTEKLFAACNKANIGSVKVLQKNGFEIIKEAQLEGDTVALFALVRPDS